MVSFQPTGHVEALDLGHEGQDVPGGVLSTEHVVMPPLDGRKVGFTGGAVEELGEVLVKLVFTVICNSNVCNFISFPRNNKKTRGFIPLLGYLRGRWCCTPHRTRRPPPHPPASCRRSLHPGS